MRSSVDRFSASFARARSRAPSSTALRLASTSLPTRASARAASPEGSRLPAIRLRRARRQLARRALAAPRAVARLAAVASTAPAAVRHRLRGRRSRRASCIGLRTPPSTARDWHAVRAGRFLRRLGEPSALTDTSLSRRGCATAVGLRTRAAIDGDAAMSRHASDETPSRATWSLRREGHGRSAIAISDGLAINEPHARSDGLDSFHERRNARSLWRLFRRPVAHTPADARSAAPPPYWSSTAAPRSCAGCTAASTPTSSTASRRRALVNLARCRSCNPSSTRALARSPRRDRR